MCVPFFLLYISLKMIHETSSEWKGGIAFEHTIQGFKIVTGENPEAGLAGPSPKRLLLAGLAGCTGYDLAELLQKMRQNITGLRIEVEGDQTDDHPKVYRTIKLVYHVFGTNVKMDKIKKAIDLSQQKLCGVTAMLEQGSEISYRIELHDPE